MSVSMSTAIERKICADGTGAGGHKSESTYVALLCSAAVAGRIYFLFIYIRRRMCALFVLGRSVKAVVVYCCCITSLVCVFCLLAVEGFSLETA